MKQLLLSLLSILLFSCQTGSKSSHADAMNFRLDTVQTSDINPVSDVKYLSLEQTDNSLIGSIDKVLYRNKRFYIFDKSANMGILVFNEKGKFIKALHRLGEGPGEYIAPIDFDVDAAGNVYIADNARQKIIKYLAEDFGEYQEYDLGCYFMEFAVVDDEHIILSEVYGQGKVIDKLAVYSNKDKNVKSLLKSALKETDEQSVPRGSSHYLYRSADNVYFYQRFTPEIYSVNAGGAELAANILSDKYFKEEELKALDGNAQAFFVDMTHIKDISAFYETADGYFCAVSTFPLPQFYWISKTRSSINNLNLMNEDGLLGQLTISGIADDYLICSAGYSEEVVNAALKINGLNEETRQMFSDWNDDSNPILILFRVKR